MKMLKSITVLSFLLAGMTFASCGSDDDNNGGDPSTGTEPDTGIYEAVDLGLSVRWASHNVGATKPEETGGYYAWGETEEKENYTKENYSHETDGRTGWDYDISGTEYDVAHVKWGGSWRLPTREECKELWSECTHTRTTQDGVKGMLFTGPNGRSIFLPYSGFMEGDKVWSTYKKMGFYQSGRKNSTDYTKAYGIGFQEYAGENGDGNGYLPGDYWYLYNGRPVRPVTE